MKVSKPALDRFKSWLHVQFDDELRPNRTLMLQFENERAREDTVDDKNSFDIIAISRNLYFSERL